MISMHAKRRNLYSGRYKWYVYEVVIALLNNNPGDFNDIICIHAHLN